MISKAKPGDQVFLGAYAVGQGNVSRCCQGWWPLLAAGIDAVFPE